MDFMGGLVSGWCTSGRSKWGKAGTEGYYPSATGKIVPPFMFIARAGE
jgi:hypothetical protein